MIKLKDILLENDDPNIFIPRRIEGRVERMIKIYIRNGNKGSLNLQELDLTVLPVILKDITVGGSFYCYSNRLTSLEGSPKTVGGSFYCYNNRLTSLDGSPKTVGGSFGCNNNLLTSLAGAPSSVGEIFYCYNNPVQFTIKDVKSVCDVKGRIVV